MQSTILFNDQKNWKHNHNHNNNNNNNTTTTTQLQQQIEFEQLSQLFECRIDNSNNNLNGWSWIRGFEMKSLFSFRKWKFSLFPIFFTWRLLKPLLTFFRQEWKIGENLRMNFCTQGSIEKNWKHVQTQLRS